MMPMFDLSLEHDIRCLLSSDGVVPTPDEVREIIFRMIGWERQHQVELHGEDQDDGSTPNDWVTRIVTYLAKAAGSKCGGTATPHEFVKAMVKVAALAMAAIESVERQVPCAAVPGPVPEEINP